MTVTGLCTCYTNKPTILYLLSLFQSVLLLLKKLTAKQPHECPSGGMSEDTVAGANSLMCVIAPEDLPEGQSVDVKGSDIGDPDVQAQASVFVGISDFNKILKS